VSVRNDKLFLINASLLYKLSIYFSFYSNFSFSYNFHLRYKLSYFIRHCEKIDTAPALMVLKSKEFTLLVIHLKGQSHEKVNEFLTCERVLSTLLKI
jgi:hypothetical protein